jgi:predicted alpha/beta-hydrolase family hydrolase
MNWSVEKPSKWDGETAIVLAHGAGQGIHSPFMKFFHSELATAGYLSVQFNFDYIEQGRKVPDPQPKLQARYRQVIEEVQEAHHPRRLIIGGKSMGGRVASYIAADMPAVSGLVFLGYPLHPPGKSSQMRDAHLYDIKKPMLFISGTKDNLAERPLLDEVVKKIGKNATMVWIEDGDHSLQVRRKGKDSWPEAVATIKKWIKEN